MDIWKGLVSMKYYVLASDGTRITDIFGRYVPAMSESEAREYIAEEPYLSMIEVSRFKKYQGY